MIDRIISPFLDWFEGIEKGPFRRPHAVAAVLAGFCTVGTWYLHLTHPHLFGDLATQSALAKLLYFVVLVPPFLAAFCLGKLVFPAASTPASNVPPGPMSAYLAQEAANRKRWLLIGAGAVAAVNLLLMMITSF
ncbi:MAG: hypothetical protein WAO20_19000 [Acidobacteriota bacterium]